MWTWVSNQDLIKIVGKFINKQPSLNFSHRPLNLLFLFKIFILTKTRSINSKYNVSNTVKMTVIYSETFYSEGIQQIPRITVHFLSETILVLSYVKTFRRDTLIQVNRTISTNPHRTGLQVQVLGSQRQQGNTALSGSALQFIPNQAAGVRSCWEQFPVARSACVLERALHSVTL